MLDRFFRAEATMLPSIIRKTWIAVCRESQQARRLGQGTFHLRNRKSIERDQ